jgi:hypothetical protein
MTWHEMLVSAGPVVLYFYMLCNKFYLSAAILMLLTLWTRMESWADVDF